MIEKVVKTTWTQKDGRMGYQYIVTHGARKDRPWQKVTRAYSFRDNLPMTVLSFLLSDDTVCETEYKSWTDNRILKRETFKKVAKQSDQEAGVKIKIRRAK